MTRPFDVIGTTVPKRDGAEKVTGRTRYLHDLVLPRLAHGKILRSRHPHARLVRVDTRRARALPGVLAVLTGDDVEPRPFGVAKDQTALKRGKVRSVRDEVAAVAAETPELAEAALALIDVEYAELPAVFDPRVALVPGAPLVHEELGRNAHTLRYQFSRGDVDRALAEAAVVVEDAYRLPFVTQACLGTMVALADWDPVGNLTMWTTTQVPFLYRRDLGEALGLGGDRVRVLQPPVGGNFGRGLDLYPIDVIAALLALHCRRPVKIEFDRVEEFIACPGREPCTIRLRTAADRDGRLLARDAHVTIDNGAYTSWGSTTPYVMLATVAGLYRVPSVRFDTTIVYTNNPYSGSMRGYGNPESTFAVESQMDDLAERLGLDRLDVRRRNASKPGDVNPQGFVLTSFAMTECIDAAAEEIGGRGDGGAPGSRTTCVAGTAARLAAEKVKTQLLEFAAVELEEPAERLDVAGGVVFVRSEPHRRLPYEQVVRAGHFRHGGRVLVAEAFYDPPTVMLDKDFQGNVSAAYASACQAVLVDVEPETGKIEVRKIVSAHDVGRALNPGAAEGQVHGGIHMGLGYALTEKLVVEEGQILTQSFMDYAVFKAADMPEIVVRLIATVDAEGPFGAKGLGESGVIPVAAAVANALKDALGVRFTELPITPARVRAALAGHVASKDAR